MEKYTSFTKDSSDISFLVSRVDGVWDCAVRWGVVKVMEGLGRVTSINNLGGIEYGGGSSRRSSSLGGDAGHKFKHHCFPLWSVISCDIIISTHLLLKSGKVVDAKLLLLKHVD